MFFTTPIDAPSGVSAGQLCVTNDEATNEWFSLHVVKSYTNSGSISLIENIGTLIQPLFVIF